MSETPRRRLIDRVSSSPTLIGAGSTFIGNLACAGELVVAGAVRGDASVRGAFTLSDGGQWEGDVSAENAVLAGQVVGTVDVSKNLEIRKTARIHGGVRASSIAIAAGAIIDGDIAVTSGQPVIHFEERRAE